MTPIVCVGETLQERESGEAESVVEAQVLGSLASLKGEKLTKTVVAYEPVWAIGRGGSASDSDAQQMCAHILRVIETIKK